MALQVETRVQVMMLIGFETMAVVKLTSVLMVMAVEVMKMKVKTLPA